MVPLLAAMALVTAPADDPVLERLAEEAEVFAQLAPSVIGVEKLVHRGRKAPPRFRPRIGAKAQSAPAPSFLNREIVSEYGFGAMKDLPGALVELRQVVSVDGKRIRTAERARLALASNMSSEDDRQRKQLLQDFEKYGTVGAVTDLGQMLLLFQKRAMANYEFTPLGPGRMGAEEIYMYNWKQKGGDATARVYHGREMTRAPMSGELWVRRRDGKPARVTATLSLLEDGQKVEHSLAVDYFASSYGLVLPRTVDYQRRDKDGLMVENKYSYSEYRMFRVETEIKFTTAEQVEPSEPAQPPGPVKQ